MKIYSCFTDNQKKDLPRILSFKAKAQQAVVRLQGGDPVYLKPWARICEISRAECAKAMQRLQIEQLEEKGESFYQPYIANLLKDLNSMGLVEEDDGARVIYVEGFAVPLMLVKNDGGFSYDTTDMAALWYRLYEEKAEWIVYVADDGQQDHFYRLFGVSFCFFFTFFLDCNCQSCSSSFYTD